MHNKLAKACKIALATGSSAALILGSTMTANAAESADFIGVAPVSNVEDAQLDPATYEGRLVVATEQGDIVVNVEAGEAQAFMDRENGSVEALSPEANEIIDGGSKMAARGAGCNVWIDAVAGPNRWAETVDGCAVAGYAGYTLPMSWANKSDVNLCVQGRGWTGASSGTMTWKALGCGSGAADVKVPWGNSLAYTKARGTSVSVVTGAAYRWR